LLEERLRQGAVDLHLHTHASDGADAPEVVVRTAASAGLRTISITDHDTLAGIAPALAAAETLAAAGGPVPEIIPGIELSVDDDREVHLLGYFPLGGHQRLDSFLQRQRSLRRDRNRKMAEVLLAMGMPVTLPDEGASPSPDPGGSPGSGHPPVVGRLHAAQEMVRHGYVPSIRDAFDRYLSPGRPAYVERERPSLAEGIRVILEAGGVPVLAHPGLYGWCLGEPLVGRDLVARLARYRDLGLVGVEACHGETSQEKNREILGAALTLGLLPTQGSDCHGVSKSVPMFRKDTPSPCRQALPVVGARLSRPSDRRFLLARRGPGRDLEGHWEFPGGKVEPGERPEEALRRELQEELGIGAAIGRPIRTLCHPLAPDSPRRPEHRLLVLMIFEAVPLDPAALTGTFPCNAHSDFRWVSPWEALSLPLCPADVPLVRSLADDATAASAAAAAPPAPPFGSPPP